VPYIKGALFLRRIEELVGRAAFDPFLRSWFDRHAFRSVTTADFLAWLSRELLDRHPDAKRELDVETWVREPGLPADVPRPASELLAAAGAEAARWQAGTPAAKLDTRGWVTLQWLRFIHALPEELTPEQMAGLDQAFGFTRSGNSEIVAAWLVTGIRNGYEPAWARAEEFVLGMGRRKFLKPVYTEMAKTAAGLARARAIYARARPRYHSVSTGTIDGIVKWSP
jgi:hypothetical protein